MSGISDGQETMASYRVKEGNRVAIASTYSHTLIDQENMEELSSQLSFVEAIAPVSIQFTGITYSNDSIKSMVLGITSDYDEFFNLRLLDGKSMEEIQDYFQGKTCLIGERFQKEHKVNLKDNIYLKINGVTFQIIGVLRNRDDIYIPYESVVETGLINTQHDIYIRCCAVDDLDKLTHFPYFSDMTIQASEDRWNSNYGQFLKNLGTILLIIGGILMYAVINIIMIILSKFHLDQKKIGIQLACGASKLHIYCENLMETIVLSIIASSLIFAFAPVINQIFTGFGEIRLSLGNVGAVLLIDILMSMGINFGLLARLSHCNYVNLLKG